MILVMGVVIGMAIGLIVNACCVVARHEDEYLERKRYEKENH